MEDRSLDRNKMAEKDYVRWPKYPLQSEVPCKMTEIPLGYLTPSLVPNEYWEKLPLMIHCTACCVLQPAFGCWVHPKAGWNILLAAFILLCSFKTFFRDFSSGNKKKHLKNSVLSYSLKLADTQTLVDSLRGYPKLSFCLFSCHLTRGLSFGIKSRLSIISIRIRPSSVTLKLIWPYLTRLLQV